MNYSIPQEVFVKAAEQYGTPLWIYDRATIEKCVKDVQVFDTVRFAQKACPNLSVVSLIRKLGCVVDAVSAGEIVRALKAGFKGGVQKGKAPEIVYTADIFDKDALELVKEHNIAVNVGSPDMIQQLADFGAGGYGPVAAVQVLLLVPHALLLVFRLQLSGAVTRFHISRCGWLQFGRLPLPEGESEGCIYGGNGFGQVS